MLVSTGCTALDCAATRIHIADLQGFSQFRCCMALECVVLASWSELRFVVHKKCSLVVQHACARTSLA